MPWPRLSAIPSNPMTIPLRSRTRNPTVQSSAASELRLQPAARHAASPPCSNLTRVWPINCNIQASRVARMPVSISYTTTGRPLETPAAA